MNKEPIFNIDEHFPELKESAIDSNLEVDKLKEFIKQTVDYDKNNFINVINTSGNNLLEEIEEKREIELDEKKILILYILKHNKKYKITENKLLRMDLIDVREIFDKIRDENTSIIKKLINHLLNSK